MRPKFIQNVFWNIYIGQSRQETKRHRFLVFLALFDERISGCKPKKGKVVNFGSSDDLSLLSFSLSEWPINTTIGSRRSFVPFSMISFTSFSALPDDAVTLISPFSRLFTVLCCDIMWLLGQRLAVRLAVSQCHQLIEYWKARASCLILIINVQNEHAVIHNLKGR